MVAGGLAAAGVAAWSGCTSSSKKSLERREKWQVAAPRAATPTGEGLEQEMIARSINNGATAALAAETKKGWWQQ
jgi:hypothetical protein